MLRTFCANHWKTTAIAIFTIAFLNAMVACVACITHPFVRLKWSDTAMEDTDYGCWYISRWDRWGLQIIYSGRSHSLADAGPQSRPAEIVPGWADDVVEPLRSFGTGQVGGVLKSTEYRWIIGAGWPYRAFRYEVRGVGTPGQPDNIVINGLIIGNKRLARHYNYDIPLAMPVGVIWQGLAANSAIYAATGMLLGYARRRLVTAIRVRQARCPNCGYIRHSEKQVLCSECGERLNIRRP
jgi:hypothetical protein